MCLYADFDYVTLSATTPKAKKEHRCRECRRVIEPGERYWKWVYIDEGGEFATDKACAHCMATIDLGCALTGCDRVWYWDMIHSLDDEGGFVGDILVNHELSFPDQQRMRRQVEKFHKRWRRSNGELYALPKIPERVS